MVLKKKTIPQAPKRDWGFCFSSQSLADFGVVFLCQLKFVETHSNVSLQVGLILFLFVV